MNAREILAKGGTGRRVAETRMIVIISVVGACASFVFGYVRTTNDNLAIFAGLQGVVNALLVSIPLMLVETKGRRLDGFQALRQLPFALFFTLKVVLYLLVIAVSIEVTRLLFLGILPQTLAFDQRFVDIIIFAGACSLAANFAVEIGRLVGFGMLRRLLTGRYFRPRREELVFAVIDMSGSTSVAERLGDLDFHALLNAFFADIGDAAYDHDADIHKYVGDEAILAWPVAPGLRDCRAVLCVFAAAQGIERRAAWYRARFGLVPKFRAALHVGRVAAGEIGQQRREIAYVGDTVNTTSRLLDAARGAGRDIVVSQALLDRLSLPEGILVESLPPADAAGKRERVPLAALSLA